MEEYVEVNGDTEMKDTTAEEGYTLGNETPPPLDEPAPAIDFTNIHRVQPIEPPTEWGYSLLGKEQMAIALEKCRKTDILLKGSVHFPFYPFYTRCPRYMEDSNWLVPSVRKWLPAAEVYANYHSAMMMYDHFVRVEIANLKEVSEFDIKTRDGLIWFAEDWLVQAGKFLQVGTLLPSRQFKDSIKLNGENKRSQFEIDCVASVTFLRWIQTIELFILRSNTMCDILKEFITTGRISQGDIDHLKKCILSPKIEDQEDYDRILKLHEVTEFCPIRPMEDFTPEELKERNDIVENFQKSIKKAKSLLAANPEV